MIQRYDYPEEWPEGNGLVRDNVGTFVTWLDHKKEVDRLKEDNDRVTAALRDIWRGSSAALGVRSR